MTEHKVGTREEWQAARHELATLAGAELKDGLREARGYIAFAQESGTVYHTYTVTAPDPFVAPFFNFLLDRAPKPQPHEPRNYRKDEYPD
jgi:predicted dithiol-disulfide oxidoreductase (DUF899 family)